MADIIKRSMSRRSKQPPLPEIILCKKHPKHRQSPGVCSICLSEKLARLSTISRSTVTTSTSYCSSSASSSLSSYYSSSSASSYSSPAHRNGRFGSDQAAKGSSSFSFLKVKKNNVLTKSRSMAFLRGKRDAGIKEGKKKSGFWSKLLIRSVSKKRTDDQVLMHSNTVREQPAGGRQLVDMVH